MPIRVSDGASPRIIEEAGFPSEARLQNVLAESPDLLRQAGEPSLALIARELSLPDAGLLDLLFISAEGLPVAVEVKLQANGESRREVVAQAVDYLSALTAMTNDELDSLTAGNLSKALQSLEPDAPPEVFDRRWSAAGANLRAGLARLIVAVDASPPGLERIVRFLASSSDLDIQLVAVERYPTPHSGEVLVPRFLVSGSSTQRRAGPSTSREPLPDLAAAVEAYNKLAPPTLQATGSSTYYRQIRIADWPPGTRTHYEFYRTNKYLGVELHIESDTAKPLAEYLRTLAGVVLAGGTPPLVWDQAWSTGRGRLTSRLPPGTDPELAAHAMQALISSTRAEVHKRLDALAAT